MSKINLKQYKMQQKLLIKQRLKCQIIFSVNEYSRLLKSEDAVLICVLQNGLKKKLHFSTSGERSGFQGDEVWALDK